MTRQKLLNSRFTASQMNALFGEILDRLLHFRRDLLREIADGSGNVTLEFRAGFGGVDTGDTSQILVGTACLRAALYRANFGLLVYVFFWCLNYGDPEAGAF